jgi:hypothetical protein
LKKVKMTYAERNRQFVQRNDGGIALALFETTDVLLAES